MRRRCRWASQPVLRRPRPVKLLRGCGRACYLRPGELQSGACARGEPMPDFWPSCGYRLLAAAPGGRLAVSDAFLRSYLLRPELAPVPESCSAEMALHGQLLARPGSEVRAEQIAAISDGDVRDNYRIWLRFRDRLLAAPTLEAAYVALFAG